MCLYVFVFVVTCHIQFIHYTTYEVLCTNNENNQFEYCDSLENAFSSCEIPNSNFKNK